jgi:hypothetical protein
MIYREGLTAHAIVKTMRYGAPMSRSAEVSVSCLSVRAVL